MNITSTEAQSVVTEREIPHPPEKVWRALTQPPMPSFAVIPKGVWLSMSAIELLCALALILPVFSKSLAILAPVAAIVIAVQMLVFCGIHLYSGTSNYSPMMYWLVVAAVCAFIAYGRLVLKPL